MRYSPFAATTHSVQLETLYTYLINFIGSNILRSDGNDGDEDVDKPIGPSLAYRSSPFILFLVVRRQVACGTNF